MLNQGPGESVRTFRAEIELVLVSFKQKTVVLSPPPWRERSSPSIVHFEIFIYRVRSMADRENSTTLEADLLKEGHLLKEGGKMDNVS